MTTKFRVTPLRPLEYFSVYAIAVCVANANIIAHFFSKSKRFLKKADQKITFSVLHGFVNAKKEFLCRINWFPSQKVHTLTRCL